MAQKIEILKASHYENWKWAKEITEILGPEHPKAKYQWEVTNHILKELNNEKNCTKETL